MTPEAVIKIARGELGTRESPAGSNKVKYGETYGMNGQPWCAMFVWCVFKFAGIDMRKWLTPGFASTREMRRAAVAKGVTVPVRSARPGDIVIFNFPGGQAYADHVGILVENQGSLFVTIEGNTGMSNQSNGGEVMQRGRAVKFVACIIRPPWQVLQPPESNQPQIPQTTEMEKVAHFLKVLIFLTKLSIAQQGPLSLGDPRIDVVKVVQAGINGYLAPQGRAVAVNGIYDPHMKQVISAMQMLWGLAPDGIVGPATANRIWP